MPKIARKVLPLLHKNSLVVSMQNGICTDQLAVGEHRTIGCVVGYTATLIEKANLLITSRGYFIIGSIAEENKPNLNKL